MDLSPDIQPTIYITRYFYRFFVDVYWRYIWIRHVEIIFRFLHKIHLLNISIYFSFCQLYVKSDFWKSQTYKKRRYYQSNFKEDIFRSYKMLPF